MAVRRPRQKARRIVGEDVRERGGDDVGELIVFDGIPDTEDEVAARFQHAPRFAVGLRLVGEEHRPELADHGIEGLVGERQRLRIGRLPAHAVRRNLLGGMVEHRLVQVGRDNAGVGR